MKQNEEEPDNWSRIMLEMKIPLVHVYSAPLDTHHKRFAQEYGNRQFQISNFKFQDR